MSTKDEYCLKSRQTNFNNSSANYDTGQFDSINLNQNYKREKEYVNSVSSSSSNNNTKNNYDFANLNNPESSMVKDTWKKKDIINSTKNNNFEENEQCSKKQIKTDEKDSSVNRSTLSLHIAAYENNTIDETQNVISEKGVDKKLNKKTWKNVKSYAGFENPFEIPRQLNEEEGSREPEVMQFKASQKLLNFNKSIDEQNRVMEQSNSLLLNEEALKQCADLTKPIFIYEWLRYLDRILPVTQKTDIKNVQQKLVQQLSEQISKGPGAPTRQLLGRCLAQIFTIADAYDLFQTINICNDALKIKDDSNSQLPVKLTALSVLGAMYESLGRMVGRSYEEGFQFMMKWLKSAESNSRTEILITLSKMVHGLGSAAFSIHKDLFKQLSKSYLTDRVMSVRAAAATCLHDLVAESGSPVYSNDIDAISTLCLKALEGANYEVRFIIAKVFAKLAVSAVSPKVGTPSSQTNKPSTIEDVFGSLATGFLRGGIGGFLNLKSNSGGAAPGGHKEIRVGVAHAYVQVIKELGPSWLEKNLAFFIKHLLELVAKCGPLAYTNNSAQAAEVVHMRRCISFIFRHTLGEILSEPSQISACKIFGDLLNDYVSSFDCTVENDEERILDADTFSSAQVTIVSLLEISALVRQIGTAVTPLFVEASGIMEPVFACLQHPILGTRLAAAWCLRCVTYSVPSQRTPLIDRCINRLSRLEHLKKSPEAISGYALALSALLAGANDCEMGIPFTKSKQVFTIAEDMIKSACQTSKLALQKIKSGWLLVAAVITMGTPFVRHNLNRLLLLWKYAFPRSLDEAKAEKGRGDAFTWECTLESRAGALASMDVFMRHCQDLATEDIIKKLIQPVESCLATMSLVSDLLYSHGAKLRHSIYTFRIRLYSFLSRLKLKYIETSLSALLRELVADITLSDNSQSTTCSSLLAHLCTSVESTLLYGWVQNTSQAQLEEELYSTHLAPDQTFENDPLSLICSSIIDSDSDVAWPEPLPVHVASIDSAIQMFGRVYPLAPTKHKLQLTNHFLNCFKAIKNPTRLQSVQMNVLSAILCAMKSLGEIRNAKIEGEELQKANINLIIPFLNSEKVLLKCLAIETLGHLAQAVSEPQFVAGNAQLCFDKLRTIRDEKSRTGFALSLGVLHRHVGSLGSGQHLNTSVSIILALAQDSSSPTVQAWAILSLSLIATTGGGMFTGYVEPCISLCLRLLLNTAQTNVEIILCVGKLVSALITSVGPELQMMTNGGMDNMRSSFLIASAMMFEHSDSQIKAEALSCWQQLHLFAPRFVQLDRLVTNICHLLTNPHLVLRKAAVSCLRQLLQREVKEVREHAQTLVPVGMMEHSKSAKCPLPETGLEGALFEMLDIETDRELRQHIKESLNFLVQATSGELLSHWLTMCKDILASSTSNENTRSTIILTDDRQAKSNISSGNNAEEKDEDDENQGDDADTLNAMGFSDAKSREKVLPRWPSRVFAFEIVQKLMGVCDTERAHLDFALAKELQTTTAGRPDYLVLHLSDLVRMSFMGATSDNSNLRLAGLSCLQDVINRFATVPDPSFPGDVILKQFQAQVGAALRPAFDPETPSHVTAAACQVCSTWIGSGVARDLNDLRRVNQLLVSSLSKLKHGSINTQLYNESAATLEKLAILKAWAEVYIVAVKEQDEKLNQPPKDQDDINGCNENLLTLVNPELNTLVGHWLAVLRDSALLSLPMEFGNQLPESGGAFYTPDSAESCKDYYRASWPPILLATSIWLNRNNFEVTIPTTSENENQPWLQDRRETRFALLLGMCCEALCSSRSYTDSDRTIQLCLSTLKNLIECKWAQLELMRDVRVAVEMMNILHRLVLTRDNLQTQHLCADVVISILTAAKTAIKTVNCDDVVNGNIDPNTAVYQGYPGGEGINGFDSQSSLSFATLEIALCILVRQIPQINSALMKSKSSAPLHFRKYTRLPSEGCELVKLGVKLLVQIPQLCSPEGSIVVLPTVFYLVLGVLRESSRIDVDSSGDLSTGHVSAGAAAAMMALRELATQVPTSSETFESWSSVIRSSLLSLLNMAEGESRVDRAVVMLAATVMTTTLPSHFPIGAPLFHKLCRLLKNCLSHSLPAIQQKALQSITSIFLRKEICSPYIRELGPNVFDRIRPYVLPEKEAQSPTIETDLPLLQDITEPEIAVIQDSIKAIEAVLKVSTTPQKQLMFVNLLLRCLARFLCNDPTKELKTLQPHVRKLHEFAFYRINTLGPQHPEAFKLVIQSCPAIKLRIERAAQLISKVSQQQQAAATLFQQQNAFKTNQSSQKPTIELKMDFAAGFTAK